MLSGDIEYLSEPAGSVFTARVRIVPLEDGGRPTEFVGRGSTAVAAEQSAAESALRKLPRAPAYERRYQKAEDAAYWVLEQLRKEEVVEIDSSMPYILETLAYAAAAPGAPPIAAQFDIHVEDPCRVRIRRASEGELEARREAGTEDVRVVQVSGRTAGSSLGRSLEARFVGEGERAWRHLELQLTGKGAAKEAAIGLKTVQRFLPKELGQVTFNVIFHRFEGYEKEGMKVSVWTTAPK